MVGTTWFVFSLGWSHRPAQAGELRIGAATTSITPDQPVALDGHRNLRISNKIESPPAGGRIRRQPRAGRGRAFFQRLERFRTIEGLTHILRRPR
jgi:hypothetical protein